MAITTTSYTTTEDCSGTSTRAFLDAGATVVYIGRHSTANQAPTGGFLFSIPDSVAPGDIVFCQLRLVCASIASGSAFFTTVTARANDTANFVNDATNAPHPRAVAANSANGGVTWTQTGCVAGGTYDSPDISAVLNAALVTSTPSGGFHRIGVYCMTDTVAPAVVQMAAIEHATYNEARLEITYNTPYPWRQQVIFI